MFVHFICLKNVQNFNHPFLIKRLSMSSKKKRLTMAMKMTCAVVGSGFKGKIQSVREADGGTGGFWALPEIKLYSKVGI
jgi:hypothetical protein